jgi:adenine-specific DNA-methyltransferase
MMKPYLRPARLNQLKALQKIAFNIIDLVGQFEDELVKVWNKPKFAHSSNYVITLDKIAKKILVYLKK